MIEAFSILYILALFLFPSATLAATLGIGATWILYKKLDLFERQPRNGRIIIWFYLITLILNFLASVLVGFAMAVTIHFLIFPNIYLLAFNSVFCILVSIRWFDYSHGLFKRLLHKAKKDSFSPPPNSTLVLCLGLERGTGAGQGLSPVFLDAGWLFAQKDGMVFEGVFTRQTLDASNLSQVAVRRKSSIPNQEPSPVVSAPALRAGAEKKSFEKIKITLKNPDATVKTGALLFIIKERFYPFKSQDKRDRILLRLNSMREHITSSQ